MVTEKDNFIFYDNKDSFEKEIVIKVMNYANEAINNNNKFLIVLSGGATPASIYSLLSQQDCEWEKWHVYFGDERCLSISDPNRNSMMVKETFLSKVNIPEKQVHIIPAELGNEVGANQYEKELDNQKPFDLVLLGLGTDGHIASLFPNQLYDKEKQVIPVFNAPKEPKERISLTLSRLSNTKNTIFMISGKNKKIALKKLQTGQNFLTNLITSFNELSVFYCNID